jgi:hypothetical protein
MSRPLSREGKENWDRIFGNKVEPEHLEERQFVTLEDGIIPNEISNKGECYG